MTDLRQGDCLEVMRGMADASVTAIVTDPPYALEFMGKGWDRVLPDVGVWKEALRVLKPGGVLLCFGGTRTFHRLTCAIEDAGFQVRDVLCWLYGSGFPKSLAIDKAIDKRGGNAHLAAEIGRAIKAAREARKMGITECDRLFCDGTTNWTWFEGRPTGQRAPTMETFSRICQEWPELQPMADKVAEAEREVIGTKKAGIATPGDTDRHTVGGSRAVVVDVTIPATDRAAPWSGYGTALKPAWEPIVLAMKPTDGTFAANALAHGVAGINVDGCRVGRNPDDVSGWSTSGSGASENRAMSGANYARSPKPDAAGRWPANVVHDGSDEATAGMGDAARYYYAAKASKRDRNNGVENLITWENVNLSSDLAAIEGLARATSAFGVSGTDGTSCSIDWSGRKPTDLCPTDMRSIIAMASEMIIALRTSSSLPGSGTRGIIRGAISMIWAAGSSPAELAASTRKWSQATTDEKTASRLNAASALFDALSVISAKGRRGNAHSTVKPTALMRWLVRMVKMPQDTVVLDPFAGSGSTGVACAAEGVKFIGIERESEYVEIARRRIDGV